MRKQTFSLLAVLAAVAAFGFGFSPTTTQMRPSKAPVIVDDIFTKYTTRAKLDGDFTTYGLEKLEEYSHTRADGADDIATFFDGTYVRLAAEGEARFEPDGYLDEPESTNLLTYSRKFDEAGSWTTAGPPTLSQNEVGVDGVANTAFTVEDDNAVGTYEGLYQTYTKSADDDSDYIFSLAVKKATSASVYPGFQIKFTGGTSVTHQYVIDHVNGAVALRDAGNAANSTSVVSWGDFWRVSITCNDTNADNTGVECRFMPAVTTAVDGSGFSGSCVGSAVFDSPNWKTPA
jgi:hypothetical protein